MKSIYVKPAIERIPVSTGSPILAGSGVKIGDMTNKNNDGSSTSSGGFGSNTPSFDNQGGGYHKSSPAKQANVWEDWED